MTAKDNACFPARSPDGKKIAYASTKQGNTWQIFTMDADGTNIKQITNEGKRVEFLPGVLTESSSSTAGTMRQLEAARFGLSKRKGVNHA